jgi:hypothetical protein
MAPITAFLIVAYVIAPAGFASWLAVEKQRDPRTWAVLGLFFNLFALIALAAAPKGTFVPKKKRPLWSRRSNVG